MPHFRRKRNLSIERFRDLQLTDTVTYWLSGKSARILRIPHGQIFQITDMVTYGTFSTVKSMRRLNPYSDTVSYLSTTALPHESAGSGSFPVFLLVKFYQLASIHSLRFDFTY